MKLLYLLVEEVKLWECERTSVIAASFDRSHIVNLKEKMEKLDDVDSEFINGLTVVV